VTLTVSLENTVERFWEIEEPEKTYISKRTRFVVVLPFLGPVINERFSGARQMDFRRFENLGLSLKTNPVLCDAYTNFVNEYIQLGHMSVA